MFDHARAPAQLDERLGCKGIEELFWCGEPAAADRELLDVTLAAQEAGRFAARPGRARPRRGHRMPRADRGGRPRVAEGGARKLTR